MMGQRTGGQKPLFYSFKLDDHVPADHLLRGIDRCLDLERAEASPRTVLQPHRAAVDRS